MEPSDDSVGRIDLGRVSRMMYDGLMVPASLDGWNQTTIAEILAKGQFETDEFDFKSALPDPRDPKGKERLRGACCAFANSAGGYLVFGVADDRSIPPLERLVGLAPHIDFPVQFGNFPQLCVPSVDWHFRNPPIALASGNLIHVVHVPRSWKAPHAIGSSHEGWRFLKRTNKGDEGMSMEETRSVFLNFYEKRLRLQLLRSELANLREIAFDVTRVDRSKWEVQYSLNTFDIRVIESIVGDTYPLTASSTTFLDAVTKLRNEVMVANNRTRIFFNSVSLPRTNTGELVRKHNEFMTLKCGSIAELCDTALSALSAILQP